MIEPRQERYTSEGPVGRYRTPSQIDRDRVLYCPHLARLAEVTQVRTVERGFLVHNRLTHSLKVAQLARRVAEKLRADQPQLAEKLGLDPDVAEAAGLAHDIGHPPFGHIAESELNELTRDQGGFEGNAQTFRILVSLTVGDPLASDRSVSFVPGLNLTRAVLNGVLKYPWVEGGNPNYVDKWGCYKTEADVFEWARLQKTPRVRTVEAEIMDWADDITYAIHDMIDFHCAGLVPLHLLANENTGGDLSRKEIESFFQTATKRNKKIAAQVDAYREAFRDALSLAVVSSPYAGTQAQNTDLWSFVTVLIGRYLDAIMLVDPLKQPDGRCVAIRDSARYQTTILKELTWKYVILHHDLATIQHGQRKMIRELFAVFRDAISGEQLQMFPAGFAELISDHPEVSPARWASDYISGLAERDVLHLHRRLTGNH